MPAWTLSSWSSNFSAVRFALSLILFKRLQNAFQEGFACRISCHRTDSSPLTRPQYRVRLFGSRDNLTRSLSTRALPPQRAANREAVALFTKTLSRSIYLHRYPDSLLVPLPLFPLRADRSTKSALHATDLVQQTSLRQE